MAAGVAVNLVRFLSVALLLLLLIHDAHCLDPNNTVARRSQRPYDYFSFSSFTSDINGTKFLVLKDAGVSQGALQLTPDTINDIGYLANKSGRVVFNRPFRLWEPDAAANRTNYVASFNTSLNVNIFRPNGTVPGEGFAFLIASNPDAPPPGSERGYLGLTNETIDGHPDNHFVAIELDTVKESYDPNDNHIGLDINSVKSNVTNNLTSFGIQISPVNSTIYTLWVDYDGAARRIWAYMAVTGGGKPLVPVLEAPLDLSEHLLQTSYFGFSASTGSDYELNCVLAWNMSVERLSDGDSGTPAWKLGLIIGLPAAAAMAALVMGLFFGFYNKKRRMRNNSSKLVAGTLRSLPGTPREFDFKELQKATNNFDDKMKLGEGGFGVVYRGVLSAENMEVAVKKFLRADSGIDDFLKELTIINRLRHKHLVRLVGWCYKNGVLLLVYEYMPNGSLDMHLYSDPEKPLLGWDRRYNILAGVAAALHYLHYEYDQKVVHRDLKPNNILLDASFNARLGDFGLARAIDMDKTSYAELEMRGVPGTMGYIAHECFHTGKASRESDVFGFGAVILEVVSGRHPRCDIDGFQFLCDWVWKLHQEGRILDAVDPRLGKNFDPKDAERLLLLGLACSHPIPGDRPKTPAIVQVISRSVPPPTVPPLKPRFMWPAGPIEEGDDVSMSSQMLTSMSATSYASSAAGSSLYLSRDGPTPTAAAATTKEEAMV